MYKLPKKKNILMGSKPSGCIKSLSLVNRLSALVHERYQCPKANPQRRRRCLLFGPKVRRGISSPCFPGTRSGMEPSNFFHSSRFVGFCGKGCWNLFHTADSCQARENSRFMFSRAWHESDGPDAARTRRAWSEGRERERTP